MYALQSLFGGFVLLAFCWALSEDRRRIPWRMVASGIALAVLLALALLKIPPLAAALASLNGVMTALENALAAGTGFVFGHLGGGPAPYDVTNPAASFVLAFRALPLVLIIAALSAVLFHWGVMPLVVRAFAWALQRTMRPRRRGRRLRRRQRLRRHGRGAARHCALPRAPVPR